MVSDLKPYVLTSAAERRQVLRLTMQRPPRPDEEFDGGWWPRSLDPIAEFPALIAGVAIRLGPVTRLTYNQATWGNAPQDLVVDHGTVVLEATYSTPPLTVVVSGREWGRRALLVVLPDTPVNAAEFELAVAATAGSFDGVSGALREH